MLRGLIEQAVKDAVAKADKPCGVLLSGGIDSSTVAAFAGNLPTFTGYYDMPGYDEREWARLAVKGEHHLIQITPKEFVWEFDDMVASIDPFQVGPGVLGQWVVSKWAYHHGIKTLLDGEGGDELFGGYARLHKVAGLPMPEGYENYQPPADYPDTVEDALRYDLGKLLPLASVDEQICNAWGITVTAPLLDWRVMVYALSLPPLARIGKVALKEAMRGIVPDAILDRKNKMGFPAPYVYWAQEEPVRSFVLDRIGYLPDVNQPYARGWWYDLCRASKERIAA